ncbi:MAG TPA: hypothetical protein VGF48_26190 [Thermoanaerobaculia bacterium]
MHRFVVPAELLFAVAEVVGGAGQHPLVALTAGDARRVFEDIPGGVVARARSEWLLRGIASRVPCGSSRKTTTFEEVVRVTGI